MGELARHDVHDLIRRFGCRRFVETGTGIGDGLAYAARFPFDSLTSIEIEPRLARISKERMAADTRVHVVEGGVDVLRMLLTASLTPEPILFWLDAHFPGGDFGIRPLDAEYRDEVRLPLQSELLAIKQTRQDQDVILIDDMRLYLDGDYGLGPLPDDYRRVAPREKGIGFVHDLFNDSHRITLDFRDHGYIILTPHTRPA